MRRFNFNRVQLLGFAMGMMISAFVIPLTIWFVYNESISLGRSFFSWPLTIFAYWLAGKIVGRETRRLVRSGIIGGAADGIWSGIVVAMIGYASWLRWPLVLSIPLVIFGYLYFTFEKKDWGALLEEMDGSFVNRCHVCHTVSPNDAIQCAKCTAPLPNRPATGKTVRLN